MRKPTLILIVALICTACTERSEHDGKGALVEVNGNFLYKEDIQSALPVALSKEDSAEFADSYIRSWVEDVLLYEQAKRNIKDSREIERQIDSYRKTLLTHAYQQQLIAQQFSEEISEEDIQAYYEANKEMFLLDQPMIKGLFIKVPANAPHLNNVRTWYKSSNQQSIDNLEKYAMQNALRYEYFYNDWISTTNLADLMPLKIEELNNMVCNNRHVEYRDNSYIYFLNISEVIRKNQVKPFETARQEIKEILANMRQVEYMKRVKDDLYNKAVEKNKIIYNN